MKYFEEFEKAGFIKNNKVNWSTISKTNFGTTMDVLAKVTEQKTENETKLKSIHSASLSLGGDRIPCASLRCRIEKVDQLARFAGLYSDRVYIKNFLGFYAHDEEELRKDPNEQWRKRLFDDLSVLSYLRPLIEKEIIVPFDVPEYFCPTCLLEKYTENGRSRFSRELKRVQNIFAKKLKCKLIKDENDIYLEFSSPEYMLNDCPGTISLSNSDARKHAFQDLLKGLNSRGEVVVPERYLRRMPIKLEEILATNTMKSIVFELTADNVFGSSFLTENQFHINILNALTKDLATEQNNNIAYQCLTSEVPFVNEVSLKDIFKIRTREEESFVVFRSALNKAIDEYRRQDKLLTKKIARSIYADIIKPKLAILDKKIIEAKKDLRASIYQPVVGLVGAISFGMFCRIVPTETVALATAVGAVTSGAKMISAIMKKSDIEKTVRNEEMYFLWKVRQKKK